MVWLLSSETQFGQLRQDVSAFAKETQRRGELVSRFQLSNRLSQVAGMFGQQGERLEQADAVAGHMADPFLPVLDIVVGQANLATL